MEKVGNLSEQMEEASKSMASESKSMENQSGLVESPSNQKPSESKPIENLADSNKAQADKQKEKRETQNVEADQQSYKEEFHQRNGKDQIDMDHGTILTEARSNELSRPSTPVPSSAESVPKNPVKWQYTLANLIYLLIFSLPFSLLVFVWCITTIWYVEGRTDPTNDRFYNDVNIGLFCSLHACLAWAHLCSTPFLFLTASSRKPP